jgi:hypothetical protein
MINDVVGPLPEPPKGPRYPTPWRVVGSTIFAADEREVISLTAPYASELVTIIKDAVNAYVIRDSSVSGVQYWRRDYTYASPDYHEVSNGRTVRFCDASRDIIEWEDVNRDFSSEFGSCERIRYEDLPDELKWGTVAYYYTLEIESAGVLDPEEVEELKTYVTNFQSEYGFSKTRVFPVYEDDNGDEYWVVL